MFNPATKTDLLDYNAAGARYLKKGSLKYQVMHLIFPEATEDQRFGEEFYMKKLEKLATGRSKTLICSEEADVVFYFCYKFYGFNTADRPVKESINNWRQSVTGCEIIK
jgi:hypothetical protein